LFAPPSPTGSSFVEHLLDSLPRRSLDYRLMLTGMADSFVTDLTHVNRVGQHLIERSSPEPNSARPRAGSRHTLLSKQSTCGLVLPDPADGFELDVKLKDQSHGLSFFRVNYQMAIADVIAEWYRASHPHPLLLRSRDLVADAFAGHFAFEPGQTRAAR